MSFIFFSSFMLPLPNACTKYLSLPNFTMSCALIIILSVSSFINLRCILNKSDNALLVPEVAALATSVSVRALGVLPSVSSFKPKLSRIIVLFWVIKVQNSAISLPTPPSNVSMAFWIFLPSTLCWRVNKIPLSKNKSNISFGVILPSAPPAPKSTASKASKLI